MRPSRRRAVSDHMPRTRTADPDRPADRQRPPAASREPGGQYVQPIDSAKLRRRSQKSVGALILCAAIAIAILNELRVLPGGHNELYLAFSAAVCGFGIWWLGWLPLSD